jgi:hypothetical protein
LRRATILLPDQPENERVLARLRSAGYAPQQLEEGSLVRDPSGNSILLASAPVAVETR